MPACRGSLRPRVFSRMAEVRLAVTGFSLPSGRPGDGMASGTL